VVIYQRKKYRNTKEAIAQLLFFKKQAISLSGRKNKNKNSDEI
jgi:hypothetical protein